MDDSPLNGISILILEDDKLLCRRMGAYLESRGAEVMQAFAIAEARNLLSDYSFDVVLSDVHLPDGNGLDLLKQGAYPAITRVLIMTAEGGVHTAVEAMRLGAVDFLTKPFELEELPLLIMRSRKQQKQDRIENFRTKSGGEDIRCVWSNASLSHRQYEVDHCFPWSRWLNNDYWNLMPATVGANSKKREKLPSAATMHTARPRIVQWWEMAYTASDMADRFFMEAESALPLLGDGCKDLSEVFEAMQHQRARLKFNQQLAEWESC